MTEPTPRTEAGREFLEQRHRGIPGYQWHEYIRRIEDEAAAQARTEALAAEPPALDVERLRGAIALHRNHYFRGPGTILWHTCYEGCAEHIVECFGDARLTREETA